MAKRSKWRQQIDALEIDESVKVTVDMLDKTFRVYMYGTIAKANSAKYSIHKIKVNTYLVTRIK